MQVNNFLERSAQLTPDKIALICGKNKYTYNEINRASDCLAASLIKGGIKRQDRVVIFLDNSVEAVIALFGVLKAGSIFIMLNATMKSKKLNYILMDSGARVLITHIKKKNIVGDAQVEKNALEQIFWCCENDENEDIQFNLQNLKNIVSAPWSSIFQSDSFEKNATFPRTIDLDFATIIYTSGSTGNPKGVVSTHQNIVAATRSITTYLENTKDDIVLSVLPLSFDYGLYQILMLFYLGGTVVLEKSFLYPYKIIERLIEEKATGFPMVPTMASLLVRIESLLDMDFSFLRYISNTAAAMPVSHIKKLRVIFPKTQIFSMYGLTECKRVSYLPPNLIDAKPESVGVPMPNLEVSIIDSNNKEVGPGEIGELVVRGSMVMQGYWNLPEETSRTFRRDNQTGESLLYSGDLFKKDDDGYLYFVSRKDDLIKTKGERVSPKEIENVLFEIEGVLECVVIGVPDEIIGNAIKAFIVKKEDTQLTEKQVIRICIKNLEPFMIPKYVEFKQHFVRSNSGKIDKKKLV